MNKKELADKLNGLKRPFDVTRELKAQAARDGLVIVYGARDDLMEFRGAIHGEVDAYGGGVVSIPKSAHGFDLLEDSCECGEDECLSCFARQAIKARLMPEPPKIEAIWCGGGVGDPAWEYKTDIPHETFEVFGTFEGDDLYCRGIVFNVGEL